MIRNQVTGPDAAALLAGCQAAYGQASQSDGVTGGQPLGNVDVTEEAFRWVTYTPADATIDLVSAGPGSQGITVRAATRIEVVWDGGDWKVIAPPGGDWGNSATELSSLPATPSSPVRRVTADVVSGTHRPRCVVVGPAVGAVAGTAATGALNGIASAVQSGVDLDGHPSLTWWVQVPSPDLAGEPAVGQLQQWMLPIAVAVAVLGMIIAGGRMALTRKANPLIDVGSGLAVIAATSAVGVLLPTLLLRAG